MVELAQPWPRTWLSLGRYAQIMGLNPISLYGAVAKNSTGEYISGGSACNEVWHQYDWQDADKVSRTALALAIQDAENDLAQILRRPLAPTWIAEEVHAYPKFHRVGYGAWYNADGRAKAVLTDFRPVIAAGRRGVTLLGIAAPDYYDLDADGFFETARVSIAVTYTDANAVKVYFKDTSGSEEWEIRPCRRKSISGGVFTADFYTWQLIDPDLWENFPTLNSDEFEIDLSGNPPSGVVSEVEVYYEHNDTTAASAQLFWSSDDCPVCELTVQDACLDIRDAMIGEVAPWPAEYVDGEWSPVECISAAPPDMVKLWYLAGEYSQRYQRGFTHDPLSDKWARVIARLATARLSKPICSCGNLTSLFEYLSTDLAVNLGERSFSVDFELLGNPLGSRRGEIEAWQFVHKLVGSNVEGTAL